jgi:hypothetical protein
MFFMGYIKSTRQFQQLDHNVRAFSSDADYSFLYNVSATQDPRWNPGDRVVSPDGRVFRYARAYDAVQSGYLARNWQSGNTYAVLAAAAAIGATSVSATIGASDFIASGAVSTDELAGGYIVFNHNTENSQFRGILGNSSTTTAGGTATIYLDAAIAVEALTTSSGCEILPCPYRYLVGNSNTYNNGFSSFLGVPVTTAAQNSYFWLQTWGPCWVTPPASGASAPGYTSGDREVYALPQNGTIVSGTTTVIESGIQHIGFILEKDPGGTATGAPFIMLQISV